mmetsp:Transcript_39680/g.97524  ORF Transcript_39680/g.97524 Transcript_39680/m.97524 type:complete len:227 (-) Transcript_39680:2420-3100(-)
MNKSTLPLNLKIKVVDFVGLVIESLSKGMVRSDIPLELLIHLLDLAFHVLNLGLLWFDLLLELLVLVIQNKLDFFELLGLHPELRDAFLFVVDGLLSVPDVIFEHLYLPLLLLVLLVCSFEVVTLVLELTPKLLHIRFERIEPATHDRALRLQIQNGFLLLFQLPLVHLLYFEHFIFVVFILLPHKFLILRLRVCQFILQSVVCVLLLLGLRLVLILQLHNNTIVL